MSQSKETSWGGVSDWYSDHLSGEDTYHAKVILPNLSRLVSIQKGEVVLDLACGTGFFAKAWKDAGAEVVGADVSPELVGIASKNVPGARFEVAPANSLSFLSDRSIDKISFVLAAQNIEDTKGMMSECRRVLRSGGKMFIVMNHPAFRVPKRSAWGFDEKEKKVFRRVDGYLSESKEKIEMHPGSDRSQTTTSFHRPLQFYFKQFGNAGFAATRLEEWTSHKESEEGPRKKEENRMRKEIPLFLAVELIKL